MEAPTSAHRRLARAYLALVRRSRAPARRSARRRARWARRRGDRARARRPARVGVGRVAAGRRPTSPPRRRRQGRGARPEADDDDGDGGDGPPAGGRRHVGGDERRDDAATAPGGLSTVAEPPPWEHEGRERPTWGLVEGDAIAPGRTVLRQLGGGRRYEVFLVWDDHRLAVLVAKVLRPDQATRPAPPCATSADEAEALARLAHPVIVRGFDAVTDGRFPHLADRAPRRPDAARADRPRRRARARAGCCRSACTRPPRCTTWPARGWSTSTSSPRTS